MVTGLRPIQDITSLLVEETEIPNSLRLYHGSSKKYQEGQRLNWQGMPLRVFQEPEDYLVDNPVQGDWLHGTRLFRAWYMDAVHEEEELGEDAFRVFRADIFTPLPYKDGKELLPGTYQAIVDIPQNDQPLLASSTYKPTLLRQLTCREGKHDGLTYCEHLFLR